MDTCCFFSRSRSDSDSHYHEDYKDKSVKYLKAEKKSLEKKISREKCLCCIYTTSTVCSTIITIGSKGASAPLTVPSAILTTAHVDKSRQDIEEFEERKTVINQIISDRKIT